MLTLNDIKTRCKNPNEIEEDDCWVWGAKVRKGRPPIVRDGEKVVQVRRLVYELAIGEIGPKRVIVPKCWNDQCVNPHHMAAKSMQQHIRAMAKQGKFASEVKKRKIAQARRAHSKLSDQDVEAIRTSDAQTCELAKEHSVHPSYIRALRANRYRLDYTANTFAGLFSGLLRAPELA